MVNSHLVYVWPHNPATGFRPPSATVVSAEPFSHGTRTLRCLQKEMATYRHWSVLVARPRRCPTLSNLVPWQNWMVAYLGYTLRMKSLFRGWPVMVHDTHTHTRRRRIQVWFSQAFIRCDLVTFLLLYLMYLCRAQQRYRQTDGRTDGSCHNANVT